MLAQRKPYAGHVLAVLLVLLLLAGCSSSKYTTSDGYSGETRYGNYSQDNAALAAVHRVALLAFTAKNHGSGKGVELEPIVMDAFKEFLSVFEEQDEIELVPPADVVASPEYQAIQTLILPNDVFSPFDGLTYIREEVPDVAVAELCKSLNADAVMMVHIDYDWDFPTWNGAEFKTRKHAWVLVPPDGHAAWKLDEVTWIEQLVPLPSNAARMAFVKAEEWPEIVRMTVEAYGNHTKWMGGAIAYYLLEDAAAVR